MGLLRIGVIVALCIFASCVHGQAVGELYSTLEDARRAMKVLRPTAALENIQVGIWSDQLDLRALISKAKTEPWYLDLEEILVRQGPSLIQLQILSIESIERIREEFGSIDPTLADADGIAFPASGRIFIDPDSVASVRVVAHELTHVLSHRKGYERKARARISLLGGPPLDSDWVDLDALICVWALSEGEAEFTAKACTAHLAGGHGAVQGFWKKPLEVDVSKAGIAVTGPATIQTPSIGTVKVRAGETYHLPPGSLTEVLTYVAYDGSLATVQAYHDGHADLEKTLERMWTHASLTTRELLFPRSQSKKSVLADAVRSQGEFLSTRSNGAFRVGGLLLSWMLVDKTDLDWHAAMAWAESLEDDLCLRVRPSGLVWITEWSQPERAEEFSRLYARIAPSAQIRATGREVIVVIGEVGDAQSLVKALTE